MTLDAVRSIPLGLWLGVLGGIVFAVFWVHDTRQRGLALIERWAAKHGFSILHAKRRTFVPPRLGMQFPYISFFRVTVRDAANATKHCWIRVYDLSRHSKDIEVFWDAEV
jgi:hypothetical protein